MIKGKFKRFPFLYPKNKTQSIFLYWKNFIYLYQQTKTVNGRRYIFDEGRWVSVYGVEVDPHDPDYLSFVPLKNNQDETD